MHSILNQTYPNIKIIVSDDASTDDTIDIVKRVSCQSINVVIHIKDKNEGLEKNVETAFNLSKGKYISLSDQDDIWMPNKI